MCVSYYGGSTHTDLALSTARNAVLTSLRGARDGATKTVILLTDGQSFNTRSTEMQVLSGCHHIGSDVVDDDKTDIDDDGNDNDDDFS